RFSAAHLEVDIAQDRHAVGITAAEQQAPQRAQAIRVAMHLRKALAQVGRAGEDFGAHRKSSKCGSRRLNARRPRTRTSSARTSAIASFMKSKWPCASSRLRNDSA